MGMLIALLPALFLGSNSVMTAKIDGKPSQGTLGTTFGAFLFAVLMAVCYTIPMLGHRSRSIPASGWWAYAPAYSGR